MIIGEIKLPKKIPNLNQSLFRGVSILEFNKPKIKKTNDTSKDHALTSPSFNKGQNATIKNIKVKNTPKLLFELIFISLYLKLNRRLLRFHVSFINSSYLHRFFHSISSKWFAKFLVKNNFNKCCNTFFLVFT